MLDSIKPPRQIDLSHKILLEGAFWQHIPAYAEVTSEQFLDHLWQSKHSVTRLDKLIAVIAPLVSQGFIADLEQGFAKAPMAVRVSPYIMALIQWSDPVSDPLRRQFLPLGSELRLDHPQLTLDSLHEQADAPVPGLTHRYPDKALFLPLDTCPVYCRFCTRSYAVGPDSETVDKVHLGVNTDRWQQAFDYIASKPMLEDIVISGGDAFNLRPEQLRHIGDTLLAIPHIRRLRFATKGLAVMPQKILTHDAWFSALVETVAKGRSMHKQVVLHTHFNHPTEITEITQRAVNRLFSEGVTVRNQSVLQAGVNDDADTMTRLVKRLGYINVHPYYVYQHDMVKGVEDLRTTVQTAIDLEKAVRGNTAGFNTPTFVVDAPGGGGKRDVHSFERYDRELGIVTYTASAVKPGKSFYYFDPVHLLPEEGRMWWEDPVKREKLLRALFE